MRKRSAIAAGVAVLAAVLLIPIVAFAIVPLFVRSTLNQPLMVHSLPSPASEHESSSDTVPTPPVRFAGDLRRIDRVHYGSGRVTLAGGVLRFENADVAGAPNMYVYLSDRIDGQPGNFVDLGPLKATNGSFNYVVPDGVAWASARSVVVWCRAFSVTVTFAVLSLVSA
jgi:hypothetical protein